jgi:Protein of unknown function (DUF3788)
MDLPNAFIDKPEKPTDDELSAALGASKPLWEQLLAELADEYDVGIQEWNSYSPKAGWSLRLKHGKRNIVYLSPCRGCFKASFALGDKAVQAARQGALPPRVIKIINEAKRYAEGTAVRIQVNEPKDIAVLKKLVKLKLEN